MYNDSERNSRWHHYTCIDEICRYKIIVLIAENYRRLRVSPFSSTNCLWKEKQKKKILSKNAVTEKKILSAECEFTFNIYVKKYFLQFYNKVHIFLIFTRITPRSTKFRITFQASFKYF
jgi:hypothetical protein